MNNKTESGLPYYIGLTQWHHSDWYIKGHKSTDSLSLYSRHFNSVEGNNTFYGLPNKTVMQRWREDIHPDFRFCLKVPKTITHDAQLKHCAEEIKYFFKSIDILQDAVSMVWFQMSAAFDVAQLPNFIRFMQLLPQDYHYGIEVRHLSFFDKAENERQFNRFLIEASVNRVIFDTRTLFNIPATDEHTKDALRKKPRVPNHVIATAQQPFVRFISPMDIDKAEYALEQWVVKVAQWIEEGRTPHIFFHTPDNVLAPQLALRFSERLHHYQSNLPHIQLWPSEPQQIRLL